MKKFLLVLGAVFLVILVVGGIGGGYLMIRGNKLDRESKEYAEQAFPVIFTNWNAQALFDHGSSKFQKTVSVIRIAQLFQTCDHALGHMQSCAPAQGEAVMSATTQEGRRIFGNYTAKATYEKGEATLALGLEKEGDHWEVRNFTVHSPQLLEQ